MQLNIKNDEARALAVELAQATGESISAAVTRAIRERLHRLRADAVSADDLLAIGRDCAPRLKEPWRSAPIGDLLYDETGLPK